MFVYCKIKCLFARRIKMLWGVTFKGCCFTSLQEKGCGSWCIPIRETFENKK